MIQIGNCEFRTLNDPIYANNQVVKQVWANGTMVYPEGNYIKLKCFIDQTYVHSHPPDMDKGASWACGGFLGPCTSSFSIKGVAILIMKCASGSGAIAQQSAIERVRTNTSSYGDPLHSVTNLPRLADGPYFTTPLYNEPDVPCIMIQNNPSIVAAKVKYRMSMVPICGPWQYAPAHTSYYFVDGKRVKLYHDAVGNDQTEFTTGGEQRYYGMYPSVISYRTYRITPVLYHLVGPAEFNDRVFSYKPDTNKGEIPFSVQSGLEAKGKVSINASSRGIGIYSMNYRFPVNVLKIVGKPGRVDETEEDLGTYYSESVFSCYIPATKILYAGYESDAPPEAKTIADEELSLD